MIILMNSITDIPKLIANGGGEVDMPLISTVNYVLVQLMTDSLFDNLKTLTFQDISSLLEDGKFFFHRCVKVGK